MAAPGATATMRADHVEIVARIDGWPTPPPLSSSVGPTKSWPATPTSSSACRPVGLSAILQLHFHKEEEVLLPVLDASLDPDAAAALFARMGEVAHH